MVDRAIVCITSHCPLAGALYLWLPSALTRGEREVTEEEYVASASSSLYTRWPRLCSQAGTGCVYLGRLSGPRGLTASDRLASGAVVACRRKVSAKPPYVAARAWAPYLVAAELVSPTCTPNTPERPKKSRVA
jgi:hypothetical protein